MLATACFGWRIFQLDLAFSLRHDRRERPPRSLAMETQSYATHRHNPRLTGIGFACVLVAIVGLALRWFGIGGRTTFALGLLGLIAADLVLLSISRSYTT